MFPNLLTTIRIIAAPILVVLLIFNTYNMMLFGLFIFVIASITDFLDGYFARLFNQKSKIGKILDPIADKLLVSSALIGLISIQIITGIHIIIATIIILREIFVSGLREFSNSKNLNVNWITKFKTSFQMVSIIFLIPSSYFNYFNIDLLFFGLILLWLASILSLITAYKYFLLVISDQE